jgi:CYTH domain-containing protein
MGKEIERKFLLAKGTSIPIPEDYSKLKIQQGYISVEKDKQVRVRITTEGSGEKTIHSRGGIVTVRMVDASICIKYTSKLVRDEFEFDVDLDEAKSLFKKCQWSIEKKRLSFDSHVTPNEVHYDVDSFPNGMQWIEVEFSSVKAMKKWEKNKPSWIGKEITGVRKYSNITLAKKNLKFNGKGKN